MATNFPPQLGIKADAGVLVRLMPVTAAEAFVVGELVYLDTAVGTIKVCGADPALIAGIAYAPASMGLAAAGSIWGGTNIPVALLSSAAVVFMASSTTPVFATHVGNAYGVEKTTNWRVDIGDTSATRVDVVDISISPQQEGFFVRFKAANLQFDAIAS